jgi:hypothetical protein
MLKEVLSFYQEDETKSLNEIALALHVSIPLLLQMLVQLTKQGFLQELSSACESNSAESCKRCSEIAGCNLMPVQKVWSLTEKGRRQITQQKDYSEIGTVK